jgi:chemotaxis protein methyltransferase CheR
VTVAELRPVRGADAVERGPALPDPRTLRALGVAWGLDLGAFRATHVARTIARAVDRTGLADATELTAAVARDPALRARLRRAVAVSTTGMFRDPEQFRLLERLLEQQRPRRRPPRVWSVGASDGSELCSLAMVLAARGVLQGATLLGSDLLPENVERARGRSRERLDPEASAVVRFEQRDVTRSVPVGSWDVILCRNVTIHLEPGPKREMLDRVAAALAPGGLLLLGRSERLPRDERRGLLDAGANAYRRAA